MRWRWKNWVAGITIWTALGMPVMSQGIPGVPAVPGIPAAPAIPGVPAGAGAAAGQAGQVGSAAAQPQNIWSKILPTEDQCARLKKKFCSCSIVQFLNTMMLPMTAMTGGMIKGCCPSPEESKVAAGLEKPADSADGAAARIKKDEAEAKARRENVRFLGTVDCSRYPEAEKALINALRTDRNECVRMEAAIVLGHGCCCTKDTIEALKLTATGSDKDGNPKERSERVRDAAALSLEVCSGQTSIPPEPPEKAVPAPFKTDKEPAAARVEPPPPASGLLQAVFTSKTPAPAPEAAPTPPAAPQEFVAKGPVPSGQRGLFDIFRRSFGTQEPPTATGKR